MIVRQSTIEDVPPIIDLLKLSIGEKLTPKTEAYFLWKHEKNAFGRSKVLLAIEDEKIIGLRAFMHWRWISTETIVSAVRAVDTSTDPAFQGKGIFKRLTLQAVEECRNEHTGMVFNSPNPVSMQGYMKMGWHIAGKLPLYMGKGVLFPQFFDEKKINTFYDHYAVEAAIKNLQDDWALPVTSKALHTPISKNYLSWRYRDCPVAKYGAVIEAGKFGIVFRVKAMKSFSELRICEVWSEPGFADHENAYSAFKKIIKEIKPAIISCAGSPLFLQGQKKIVPMFGPFRKGPMITIRPLALTDLNQFDAFKNWQPSLGSMELF